MADIVIRQDDPHATVVTLYPASHRGMYWMEDNIETDLSAWSEDGAVPVEIRFLDDILDGALADGLALGQWTEGMRGVTR